MTTNTQIATVDFHGHALTVITGPAGEHQVAVRLRLAAEHRIDICGHRDLPDVNKACPCFDVAAWLGRNMEAPV